MRRVRPEVSVSTHRGRRIKVIAVAVATVAIIGLVVAWRMQGGAGPSASILTPPSAPADPAPSSATLAMTVLTPRARLLAAEKQVVDTPDSACAMPTAPSASGIDAEDAAARAAFMQRPEVASLVKGIRHIDDSLRTSADPFARAVALWLNVPRADDASEGIPDDERQRELATMAASTTDPRIYALAFRTCGVSGEAACRALSARRWAVLDPDNAVPWLFLLNDAERAHDVSGQQEAWFHIAAAARFDERFFEQLQPILAAAGDLPDDQRAADALSVMGIGMAAAQTIDFGPLLQGCRGQALADANRAQLCTRAADLLFEHSDAPFARQLGAIITKRLTGDNRRNEQVAEETQFMIANNPVAPQGCAELRSQLGYLRDLATRGSHGAYAARASGVAPH